jgi:hypothetical protein
LYERRDGIFPHGVVLVTRHEDAEAPHAVALLRVRCEWPRRRAAEERDELAAFHSMISSAMASSL